MASPAHQTSTTLAGAFRSTSATISVPSGVAAGDIIEIFVYREDLADTVASSGFTSKAIATADDHRLHLLYKRATAGDTGTYTVTFGGNDWTEMACRRTSGCVASGDPYDFVTTANANTNGTAAPNVSGTTTVADTLLSYAASNTAGGAWTPPTGFTERTDIGEDVTTATLAQAGAGGTGTLSASCAGSGHRTAILGALKSPGGTTVTGTIATTFSLTATAVGTRTVRGTISTNFSLTATAAGLRKVAGAISTTFTLIATAIGTGGAVEGEISTTFGFTATAVGKRTVVAAVATTFALTATAVGKRTVRGAIATTFTLTATAVSGPQPPDLDPEFPWVLRAAPGYGIFDDIPDAAWQDVTSRVVGAITRRVGRERPGEDAPATQLTFTLNTDDGLIVPELVTSDWWPYVDLGLPFQFWRADSSDIAVLRSTVAADSYKVNWPTGLDDHATVTIVASGPLRWMDQGEHVDLTAQASAALADTPLAYWPCTDADGATTAASAVAGGMPMTRTTSDVRFGQITGPDGTAKYPSLVTSGRLAGQIPVTAVTTVWAFELIAYIVQASADWFTVAYLTTTSASAKAWRLRWDSPTGPLTLRRIDGDGTETVVVTASVAVGAWKRIAVQAVQNAGNVDCAIYVDGVSAGTGTASSATTGRPTTITVGDFDGPGSGFQSVGEVTVYDHVIDYADRYEAQQGYDGEMAHVRAARVAAQLGVPFSCAATVSMRMGPQKDETVAAAIKGCADSDGGILTDDRTDPGLRYVATSQMYNQAAALTLNAREDEHLQLPFAATRDDSQAATDVTITRDGGSSRRVSVDAPRAYADSDTLSLYEDDLARAVASWRAHHGAQTDLRYDAIVWDCVAVPGLLDATLALRCGHRIVVEDLPRPHPQESVSLILQGWTEVHDTEVFQFAAKVSPARLFEVATVGSDDPEEWDDTTARLDSDNSTVDVGVDADDTAIVVASDYGWSTTATPYSWNLLGEKVTVTSITAYSGGVQTATVTRAVNGISKAIPADTPVRLWRPAVIGL